MAATLVILISVIVIASIIIWRKTDWQAINKQNEKFYIDGYHIYYDRNIIRQLEHNNSEIH